MQLELEGPVGRYSPSAEEDVRALKIVLNRLGYYMPDPKHGLNEWTDVGLFDAIKDFQIDHGLSARGEIRPGDETYRAVNDALKEKGEGGHYIWRTVEDDHVRADHAARAGHVFSWADHPHPGEEHGCRCWGEEMNPNEVKIDAIEAWRPENLLLLLVPLEKLPRLLKAWKIWTKSQKPEWMLGRFKSEKRWGNQLRNRDWTPDQITQTLKYGTKYKAPNKVNPNNTATRYEYKDRFVVQDDQTKEILQVSGDKAFIPNMKE